ncbi:MAG: hypothetical protein ACLQU2_13385 [Candidatus Binataceae bacterium]
MTPLKNWQKRYAEAFSEVCELVHTVEIATKTRSGAPGETYRVEIIRTWPQGDCAARYLVMADGRWVEVNIGTRDRVGDPDEALNTAFGIVANCAHSAR